MANTSGKHISAVTLVVPDYDEAISFYVGKLGFSLIEDAQLGAGKRWVLVAPADGDGCRLLLARAEGEAQKKSIGNQAGGRVFMFLTTSSFEQDHEEFRRRGVEFLEEPRREAYGTVAVFKDPFGNKWDLIEQKR